MPACSLVKYYYCVLASLLPGQPVNVRTSARRLEKWTRHRVAFNYPYLQSGLLCNWPPTPASRNCTPSLGTTWRQSSWKSNKHFFTDKRFTKYLCCPDFQGCIFRLTCSYPELTEDHVLTSAYVKIFRTVTRNAVNKSV